MSGTGTPSRSIQTAEIQKMQHDLVIIETGTAAMVAQCTCEMPIGTWLSWMKSHLPVSDRSSGDNPDPAICNMTSAEPASSQAASNSR